MATIGTFVDPSCFFANKMSVKKTLEIPYEKRKAPKICRKFLKIEILIIPQSIYSRLTDKLCVDDYTGPGKIR